MFHTLSGRIVKVADSHAEVAKSIPAEAELIYTMHEALRGTAHKGGGCEQSIESTVSDAIVRSWLSRLQLRVSHWVTSVDYCK